MVLLLVVLFYYLVQPTYQLLLLSAAVLDTPYLEGGAADMCEIVFFDEDEDGESTRALDMDKSEADGA